MDNFLHGPTPPDGIDSSSETLNDLGRGSIAFERAPLEKLYEVAFLEGEGIGTAYEYLVKWRSLQPLFKFGIRSILVLGLPEKYGTSMDFVMLADHHGCGLTMVDDRSKSVNKCRNVLREMTERGLLRKTPRLIEVDDLLNHPKDIGVFDLALSCEVLQRLAPIRRRDYVRNALGIAKYAAVFAPNKSNGSHAKISKLGAMELSELQKLFNGYQIVDEGYVDMPPFPPGLKTKSRNRASGTHRALQDKIVIRLLDGWSKIERLSTGFKPGNSHIVFVMAAANSTNPPESGPLRR
jgi:hypothetical protein